MPASSQPDAVQLSPQIRSLLSGLRWRIRAYVWLQGAAVAVLWLALTFWVALALDYFPVLVGATEMPRTPRAVILALISVVLLWILYRWILRRTFVRLADHSMALLLERRYRRFHDSLVTAVEMEEHPDHAKQFNPDMLHHSVQEAEAEVGRVRLSRVFRTGPLLLSSLGAVVMAGTIGLFALLSHDAFALGAQRLYLLSDQPWPRRSEVRVVGVELNFPADSSGQAPPAELMKFAKTPVKVARGSNLTVIVQASADEGKVVPEVCTIYYDTENGDRGRVNMRRIGRISDGFQEYRFDGKPFRGLLSSVSFDVRGNDHRVYGYEINVVESPSITGTALDCVFPEYLVDRSLPAWLPRTETLTQATRLPQGTKLRVRSHTNKELRGANIVHTVTKEAFTCRLYRLITTRPDQGPGEPLIVATPGDVPDFNAPVQLVDSQSGKLLHLKIEETKEMTEPPNPDSGRKPIEAIHRTLHVRVAEDQPWRPLKENLPVKIIDPRFEQPLPGVLQADLEHAFGFEFDVKHLAENTALDVDLVDIDVVRNDRPQRLVIPASADTPPSIEATLQGIGMAVTPDVKIPVKGEVRDDYAVARSWFEFHTQSVQTQQRKIELELGGKVDAAIDFRAERTDEENGVQLQAGDKLTLAVKAEDKHDLEGGPNIGSGDRHQLDVVTHDDLRRRMEVRELEIRERLVQIIGEVDRTRGSLGTIALLMQEGPDAGSEPEDKRQEANNPTAGEDTTQDDALEAARRARERPLRRVEDALLQSEKSAGETLGVAEAFDDIRAQLENNRIDSEDRKQDLKEKIADPLRHVSRELFPQFDERLNELQAKLQANPGDPSASDAELQASIAQVDEVLVRLNEVLSQLSKLESFNELLQLVRNLIETQNEVIDLTEKQRKKQALDLLK